MTVKDRKRHCPGETPGALFGMNRAIRRVLGVSAVAVILLSACLAEPAWTRTNLPLNEFTPERYQAAQQFAFNAEHGKALKKIVAMGAIRLRFVHKGTASTGYLAATYDNRWGTGVDASGNFAFALRAGCRNVYVNGGRADDTGDGLTPATAKKTLAAAATVYFGAGWTAGDHLMVAQGFTYTDPGTTSTFNSFGGFSAAYPSAVQSYDPADATNTAKFGRATDAATPVINLPTSGNPMLGHFTDNGNYYYAVQGVEFGNTGNAAAVGINVIYRTDGTVYQNCRFKLCNLALNNAGAASGLTQGSNVSKCSFWGAWATTGNTSGLYIEHIDGFYMEDCAFFHCGWKMGALRSDTTANGGPDTGGRGHAYYYHASNINGRIQRVVGGDSAQDSQNIRGGAAGCNDLVSIDDPIAGYCTQISSDYASEAPFGRVVTVTDYLVMGGDHIDDGTTAPRGQGIYFRNAAAGTGVDNVLMIDNPKYGTVNNIAILVDNGNSNLAGVTINLNRLTTYNFAPTLQSVSGAYPVTLNYTNCITDTLASGGSGNSVWSVGTFPNAKTRDQVVTALLSAAGITPGASYAARKAQLVNLILWRPDLDWARYLISIAFPAYNKTTTRALLSPPSLAALSPPAVY